MVKNTIFYLKVLISLIGGSFLALIGGWDLALQVLVIMVVIDYITGLAATWYKCCLNSNTGL